MHKVWHEQVKLLLAVLPEVAKEQVFALHGGTAINLFVRDMPRLSVDIDLTFMVIADRQDSFDQANAALASIIERLSAKMPSASISHDRKVCKLRVTTPTAVVKVEVNMVGRGLLGKARQMSLCNAAQETFDLWCAVPVVSHGQLFGGKLCAALDRQHPRDLFDTRMLLDSTGLTDDVRAGLMLALASSPRPTHELLLPNLLDQSKVFVRHFVGMTAIPFTYADYERTRLELVDLIRQKLTQSDKAFLLGLNQLEPDWSVYPFADYPAVRWKRYNLEQFRVKRPNDWAEHCERLAQALD